MANYLVTGGAGFIGSHLATRLVRDGHRVRVVDNLCAGHRSNLAEIEHQVEFIEADVADSEAMRQAVADIDVVFHQAALASVPLSVEHPLKSHLACATGTVTVLDAARRAGVKRVVYAASSSAYGNNPELPKRETQLPEMLSPYAAAKLTGELYCEAFAESYGIETVRLRYFNIFGPRQDPASPYSAVIPIFVSRLLADQPAVIYGTGEQSRDFTHVDNVVEANLLAATREGVSGKVYNIGCGAAVDLLTLLKAISQRLGKPYAPQFADPRPGDVLHSWADISLAKSELGYGIKTSLEEGLNATVDWYAEQARS